VIRAALRWLALLLVAGLGLQLWFVGRIALMAAVDPQSTAFQRSDLLRTGRGLADWRQQWVPYDRISEHLKRAVIASEDADFVRHGGVDWEAIDQARARNARSEARAAALAERIARRPPRAPAAQAGGAGASAPAPRIVGGSTITQQLAKNLFLSGERNLVRKGQELLLALALEALLSKERILEIYLNSVEWGDGVFGAEAAAQRYYGKPADRLAPAEAARLAVMLPRPKYFERLPRSPWLASRGATIASRMRAVELP
jgi:monofunctional biosynthetic peptidoglycan transglycosylase